MDERRQAYRMRAQADFDQLVLKVRGREVTARLYDTSLTGLGVICDPAIQLAVGEKVQVSTHDGWFSAKVVRVGVGPLGRLVGLERHIETSATTKARKDESRLVAVFFGTIVVLMPLLTIAWNRFQPSGRESAQSSPPPQLDTPSPEQPPAQAEANSQPLSKSATRPAGRAGAP
jgi:hypothetical protein